MVCAMPNTKPAITDANTFSLAHKVSDVLMYCNSAGCPPPPDLIPCFHFS